MARTSTILHDAPHTTTQRSPLRTVPPALRRGAIACACVLVTFVASPARAQVETEIGTIDVVQGTGAVTINEATQTTLTSEGQVIYEAPEGIYQPADHTLEFDQSGEDASALMRGRGQNPFEFFGTVKSNGTLVFANEAGVHFQDGSSIQVFNLIAAAGNISNDDFLTGQMRFDLRGDVTNEGTIAGFKVALLGERVANHGDIYVEDGQLLMAAGDAVWIREHGSPIVVRVPFIDPGRSSSSDDVAIENTGVIDAGAYGHVRLAAADGLAYAIRNRVVERISKSTDTLAPESGLIRAGTIEIVGGDGSGVEVGGTLDATRFGKRAVGGEIDVFGDRIAIADNARIDATGSEGGGRIRIGGDKGGGGDAPTADLVFVSESAEIRADADYAGDGGEVIVWSDGHAYVHGAISARGGEHGGDGGFVETSGRVFLDVTRAANVSARVRRAFDGGGTWLLDPYDVIVDDFGFTPEECEGDPRCLNSSVDLDDLFFVNDPTLYTAAGPSLIDASVIEDALTKGSNLILTTSTGTTEVGEDTGTIVVRTDILPGLSADENTAVLLRMRAANDIIIEGDIGANADNVGVDAIGDYENLNLAVQLIANDGGGQLEATDDDGEIPNAFEGDVIVKGDITTNGSDVVVQGVQVELREGTSVTTDGGNVLIAAVGAIDPQSGALSGGGDALLEGTIDTSNSEKDRQGEPLDGGTVTVQARSGLIGQTNGGADSARSQGGSIRVEGDITLGAHGDGVIALELEAVGGDIDVDAAITGEGGSVQMLAVRVADDVASGSTPGAEHGGRVTISENGSVTTGGGDVRIDASGFFVGGQSSSDFATLVEIRGPIDTSPADDDRDDDGLVDTIGGNVLIRTEALGGSLPTGRVAIIDTSDSIRDLIVTRGGFLEVNANPANASGQALSSVLLQASIDAGIDPAGEPDIALENAFYGGVFIDSAEDLRFVNGSADDGTPFRIRGEDVQLRSGLFAAQGGRAGDIEFVSNGAGVGPEIHARRIEIRAGSTLELGSLDDMSRIVAGDVALRDPLGGMDIESLTWAQNAIIDDVDILAPSHLGGAAALDGLSYFIESLSGSVTVDDASKVTGSGTEPGPKLQLIAETHIVLGGSEAQWQATGLQSLSLKTNTGFTVDPTLATNASAATDDLLIASGRRGDTTSDLRIEDGVQLDAADRLELHAASFGSAGDLIFGTADGGSGAPITLSSSDLRLWAGSGNGEGQGKSVTNRVLAGPDSATPVRFDLAQPATGFPSFSLRQEAAITDDDLPTIDQFIGHGAGEIGLIDYELRSDSADITLGFEGGSKLVRTNLRLLARHGVNVEMGQDTTDPENPVDRTLGVRTLDVGGTANFEVTQQLLDEFVFEQPADDVGPAPNAITLRAGVTEFGTLTFEIREPEDADDPTPPTTVTADEIRLVASDGTGGNGADGRAPSFVLMHDDVRFAPLTGGAIRSFVFDQDADVPIIVSEDDVDSPLPDIDLHFDGQAPDTYAVRSNDGRISLSLDMLDQAGNEVGFDPRLPLATQRTILSAEGVTLSRIDGQDLVLSRLFSAAPDTNDTVLEIRTGGGITSSGETLDGLQLEATDGALFDTDTPTGEPADRPDDPDDLAVVDVGNALPGQGLYVFGFGGEELDDRTELPVPEAMDLSIQDGTNFTVPGRIVLRQDGTIVSEDLLDLARSGSGCGLGRGVGCIEDRLPTVYELTSSHGDLHIRPDRVEGAQLFIRIPLSLQDDPIKSSRTILFDPDPGAAVPLQFFTELTEAVSAFSWRIDPGVHLQGADRISLLAGTSGRGDLTFGPGVILQSEDIGIGAYGPRERGSSDYRLPIVDAYASGNGPTFDFLQPDVARDVYSTRTDTDRDFLTIRQDGFVNDLHADRPSVGESRTLPVPAAQLRNCGLVMGACGGGGGQLFGYTLESKRRGIFIDDLTDVAASRLLLLANFDEWYDGDPDTVDRPGEIVIDHTTAATATIDFEAAGIERAALVADSITLIAGDGGVVDASGDYFFSANTGEQAPPLAFTIEQDQSFIDNAAEEIGELGAENIPAFFQFSTGLTGVEYTLRLRETGAGDEKIQIGGETANKVRGTRLLLEALDTVQIAVPEELLEGIVLTDLTVREVDGDDTLTITLGSAFDETNVTDADRVATLIETIEDQLFDGTVRIVGNVELLGRDITFTGDVLNASDQAGQESGLDFLTRGTVSFAGNVGCNGTDPDACKIAGDQWGPSPPVPPAGDPDQWLDRFRVRFDADDPERDALAFVGDGDQHVFALEADIFAVSPSQDFETLDVEVVRVPETASVYKRDGDDGPVDDVLAFYTRERFRVGVGQKISAQGNFEAHSEKLVKVGDISALKIDLFVDPTLDVPGDDETGIHIQKRPAAPYLAPDGRLLRDAGISFVTNSLDLHGVTPDVVGTSGSDPALAVPDPRGITDPTFVRFTLTTIDTEGGDLSREDFEWELVEPPDAFPALHTFGIPRNDISQVVVRDEITPPPLPWMADEWRVADARRLRDLSVKPRERTVAEWHRYLEGAGVIDDIGTRAARRDGFETVAQPRLLAADAQRSIELYERVFGVDGVNAPRVRAVLAEALDRYRRSSGTRKVVGFEFRRYVKNRPNSLFDAYQIFEDLDALFDHHRALGLTAGEYRPIQAGWLAQIQPEGISISELSEAVHPSRYVRGTDILEIFGD